MKKKNSFIDLFSGAGGFGLGFKMAGAKPILSVEIDSFAIETLRANSNHKIIQADLKKSSKKKFILNSVSSNPNIIIGGPPCQGFSNAANKKIAEFDSRNELVFQYLKWVKYLQPNVFIIENVPGIEKKVDHQGNKIFERICDNSCKIGYNVELWKLNAAGFGVPQVRKRAFIIGIKGLNSKLNEPIKTHYNHTQTKDLIRNRDKLKKYITVGEAILDLPYVRAKEGGEIVEYNNIPKSDLSEFQLWARSESNFVYNHAAMHHTDRLVKRYQYFIDGVKEDLPKELQVRARNGNGELSTSHFNSNYRYLNPDRPSYTIPASFYSSFVHPSIPRNITTREAARLQSFPDWYVFKGKRTLVSKKLLNRLGKTDQIGLSQYNQVGNAVPPLLAKVVGETILKQI